MATKTQPPPKRPSRPAAKPPAPKSLQASGKAANRPPRSASPAAEPREAPSAPRKVSKGKPKWLAALTFDHERMSEILLAEGDHVKAAQVWARTGAFERAAKIALDHKEPQGAVLYAMRAAMGDEGKRYGRLQPVEAAGILAGAGNHELAAALYEMGKDYLKAADQSLRMRQFERAARNYERGRSFGTAATYYERVGKIEDAVRVLGLESGELGKVRYTNKDPEVVERLRILDFRRIEHLRRLGRPKEAATILQTWKPQTASEVKLMEELLDYREAVKAYLELNLPEEARRLINTIKDADQELSAKVALLTGRSVEAAHLYASMGRPERAAEILEEAGAFEPAAQRWEACGKLERAAACYEKGSKRREAARCYLAAGRHVDGARLLAQMGDHNAAAEAFQRARRPLEAATSFLAAHLDDQAVAALKTVPAHDQNYETSLLLLLPKLVDRGEHQEALRRLNQLSHQQRLQSRAAIDYYYWEARALEGLQRTDEARLRYEKLLALNSDFKDAAERLAVLRPAATGAMPTVVVNIDRAAGGGATVTATSATVNAGSPTAQVTIHAPGPAAPGTQSLPRGTLPKGFVLSNRYTVLDVLGRGGMGQVYKAHDRELDDVVAIKTVLAGQQDPTDEERLLREVQICRKISHPNIVRVHDIGRFDGGIFVTMEFIEGLPLDALLAMKQSFDRIRAILVQILAGLAEAHALKVIHRDLKPSNIIVALDRIKILDFGIARMQGVGHTITQAGYAVGSPLYMSPEQLKCESLDARSDLYSLGVLAFSLITGREPFRGDNLTAIAYAHLNQPPPALTDQRPDAPGGWQEWVNRLLAKNPNDRFPTAQAARGALEALPT